MKKQLLLFAFIFQLACNTLIPSLIHADDNLVFKLDKRTWTPSPSATEENTSYEMLLLPQENEDLKSEPEETVFIQKLAYTKDTLANLILDFAEVQKYPSTDKVEFIHKILKETKNRLIVEWTSKDSSGNSRKGLTYFLRNKSQIFSVHYATRITEKDDRHFTKWVKILKKARIAKSDQAEDSKKGHGPSRFIFTKEGIHSVS